MEKETTVTAQQQERPLSEKQMARVNDIFAKIKALEERLNWFLAYVVDEMELPKVPQGYTLTPDRTALVAVESRQRQQPVGPPPVPQQK